MKKLIAAAVALLCATAIVAQAQDATPKKEKHKMTAEQKQVMTDMLAKYDTNKDGKLDKTERAAMTPADKEAYAKAFPAHGKKKSDAAPAAEAPAATPAK